MQTYDTILVERHGPVGLIRLNRPKALNALNSKVMREILDAATALDADASIGCMIIAGSDRAFAAGADISEMQPKQYIDAYSESYFAGWDSFASLRTPKIAAVSGYALGGGCELALMCDMIFASEKAEFGQPEIKLGVIPGIGGTQRLTRLIGRAAAMDMILTGRRIRADEAARLGLVSRVLAPEALEDEALSTAKVISGYSKPAVMMARDCVMEAEESSLQAGLRFERHVFHAVFATEDQKEGMAAFLDKRPPEFAHAANNVWTGDCE
jgi:enoyl-CoA hydratase